MSTRRSRTVDKVVKGALAIGYEPFAGLPGRFWVLFSGQLVTRFGGMVGPFLVLYLTNRGLTTAQVGYVLAAQGIGSLLSQPLGGLLADRIGMRRTMVAGLLSAAAGLAAFGAATTLTGTLLTALLVGVTADLYRPAAAAMVAETVAADQRVKAFGLMFWAINLGFSAGSVLAGFLAERGYWLLFAFDVVTSVLFAVIILVGIPRDRQRSVGASTADTGYRSVVRDRRLLALTSLTFVYFVIYTQSQSTVPLMMRDVGLPVTVYGFLAAMNALLIVVLQPVAATWIARLSPVRVLSASWLLAGAGMALNGLSTRPWHFAVAVAVWTAGEIGAAGTAAGLVSALASAGAQGRYQALLNWGANAGVFAGPVVGIWVYGIAGPSFLWWSCLVLGVLSGGAGWMIRRKLEIAPDRLSAG